MTHPYIASGVAVVAALNLIGTFMGHTPSGRLVNFLAASFLGTAAYYLYTGL